MNYDFKCRPETVYKEYYNIQFSLPSAYYEERSTLPRSPSDLMIPDHITLPIKTPEDLKKFNNHFKHLYSFNTKTLSKEWIDMPDDNRLPLPTKMHEASRGASVKLPCNKTTIYETVKILRQHYKFNRIPDEWINNIYQIKPDLPSLDNIAFELAKRTNIPIIIPISDPLKTRETVRILHRFFNFNRLPDQFFLNSAQPNTPAMVFPEDPFDL